MAAVQALLSAAGVLKPNTKLLKKSTATEHATSSSQPDPAATSNATEHAVSRLPLTGIRMSVSQLLLEKISQDTFCHTRSETRGIASETTSRATRTCQGFSDPLLTVCFASFWVTREWLFSFGNTASRASLTVHWYIVDEWIPRCSTWACYRAAWTSASSGIVVLQMTSWSTRPRKVSTPSCRRAPWTNRSGNGSRRAMTAKDPTTT